MPPVIKASPPPQPIIQAPATAEQLAAAQEKLLTATFDQAKAYSQIVLGIGYVSIFAAWSFTREFLTRDQILWSALLASLSIFVFVLFEVLSMFVSSKTLLVVAEAASRPQEFNSILLSHQAGQMRLMSIYARCWAWCWGFSFLTGVSSALILLGAFVGHLLN